MAHPANCKAEEMREGLPHMGGLRLSILAQPVPGCSNPVLLA